VSASEASTQLLNGKAYERRPGDFVQQGGVEIEFSDGSYVKHLNVEVNDRKVWFSATYSVGPAGELLIWVGRVEPGVESRFSWSPLMTYAPHWWRHVTGGRYEE
jgi:hypothetical protein